MKINSKFGKTSVPVLLSILIVMVILLELAGAYLFWYGNIQPAEAEHGSENVVRVDLPGYRKVIEFLDSLVAFEPSDEASQEGSPFIYR